MKILLSLLLIYATVGCSKKIQPTIVTLERETVKVITKDSLIKLPADSVIVHEAIPCPEVIFEKTQKSESKKLTVTAKIAKGTLTIDCKTDSLLQRIKWLEQQKEKVKEVTVKETIVKRYIPKWVWWLILINALYLSVRVLAWRFRLPVKL